MILVARAVERIAANAVEIAEQTVFVVTGLFRERGLPEPRASALRVALSQTQTTRTP
jgi:phosphate uptake regulator